MLAAHGGAGASTVARLLRWPVADSAADLADFGRHDAVVVVVATTAYGASRLSAAVDELPAGVIWLVVARADAPLRCPVHVADRIRSVAGGARALIWLPYCPAWRHTPPHLSTAPRRFRRAAESLCEMAWAAR